VLAGDHPAVSRTEPASPARLVPAQLPHDVSDFIGRDDKVERLRKLSAAAAGSCGGGAAVLATVDGAAGSGKTAFAIHVAHDMADQFPDGQLFVDLRGFDPRLPPVTTEEALRHLLHGLSPHAQVLTADVATQAAIYRSLLAGRRVLVVLDNARSAEQVRPLLPGSQGCLVLVTSRNRLAGLAIRDGATRIGIGVLRPAESLELLRRVLGADQVDAEVDMARELAASHHHLLLRTRRPALPRPVRRLQARPRRPDPQRRPRPPLGPDPHQRPQHRLDRHRGRGRHPTHLPRRHRRLARTGSPPNPVGRLGDPDRIAGLVVLLLSDRSGVVTGTVIDWDQNVLGGLD
jgi:hypothetical protein